MNKRSVWAVLLLILTAFGASAQVSLDGLVPKDPLSMGMGGSFKVFARGYSAFFGNPAGFAGPPSFTLAEAAAWAYLQPYPKDIVGLIDIAQGQAAQAEYEALLGRLIADNGFGGGASLGLGWSGGGFGMGLTLIADGLATGSSYEDAAFSLRTQLNGILGIAWPIELGAFTLEFGADIRAFYRLDSLNSWPFGDLATSFLSGQGFEALLSAQGARGGYGFAVDSGALLSLGALSAGVMIRDYGYKFYMQNTTVGDIIESGVPPMAGSILHQLVPVYSAGLRWSPESRGPLRGMLMAEVDNPMGFLEAAGADLNGALSLIHAGAELKILNFLALRGGFNQGLLSLGFGFDFALLEVDAAVFSESERAGIALQIALKY